MSTSATQVVIDAELVARLDSVVLCSRRKVKKVLVNRSSGNGFGLTDPTRERLISAFDGETFRIR